MPAHVMFIFFTMEIRGEGDSESMQFNQYTNYLTNYFRHLTGLILKMQFFIIP
jgi:hypothetical protein